MFAVEQKKSVTLTTSETIEFWLKYPKLGSQLLLGELINLTEILNTGRLQPGLFGPLHFLHSLAMDSNEVIRKMFTEVTDLKYFLTVAFSETLH